ncbi:DNA-binding protein H-NS [Bradyrhizobium sp. AZCC 1577]
MLPERPQSVSLNGPAMRRTDLETMDFDELWLLHEQLTKLLSEKITTEKLQLERRLAQLSRVEQMRDIEGAPANRPRRKYPKVQPKYWNPSQPSQKWSGRGKQPRWLVAALSAGRKLEDFVIDKSVNLADDDNHNDETS